MAFIHGKTGTASETPQEVTRMGHQQQQQQQKLKYVPTRRALPLLKNRNKSKRNYANQDHIFSLNFQILYKSVIEELPMSIYVHG